MPKTKSKTPKMKSKKGISNKGVVMDEYDQKMAKMKSKIQDGGNNMSSDIIEGETVDDGDEKIEGEDSKKLEAQNKKANKKDVKEDYTALLSQINAEYEIARRFLKPKWDVWASRLRLYNNQRKDVDAIGDPLLFTIHQTVLASLYDDKLTVEFEGRERGDDETAENLNILALYDAEQMGKEKVDYDWMWDAGFFGRGIVKLQEFDPDTLTPVLENIDPFCFFRDPKAKSVNGDQKQRGAAQYLGYEIVMTRRQLQEMEDDGVYSDTEKVKDGLNYNNDSEINKRLRNEAQGYTDDMKGVESSGDNASFQITEWYTYWKGKKHLITLANNRTLVLRCTELKTAGWPFHDRPLYPMANSWDGVSICDLVEDKQRARAILQNLSLKGVKATLYPSYLYNSNIIKNKASIAKFQFNKFVGVKGNVAGAVQPIERKAPESSVTWILSVLDHAAQQATATPDIQQGSITEKNKSATEIAKVSQGVDTRYSLSAKIFGWSEKALWKGWYEMYQIYYKDGIHTKTVRIAGALGPVWKDLDRKDIVANVSPDIIIESKILSDAKRMNKLNIFTTWFNQAVAMDGGTNKRFALKYMGKLAGLSTDEINRLLPKTFDEYEAEQENLILAKNKLPKLTISQNHIVHIELHSRAEDTPAKAAHIKMHYMALFGQRENPALAPNPATLAQNGQGPSPMEQGTAPAPRDMAQSPLQLQSNNTQPQQL